MKKPKSKRKPRAPRMTLELLAKRLAAYHSRSLLNDLSVQRLEYRVNKALTELREASGFIDAMTGNVRTAEPSA